QGEVGTRGVAFEDDPGRVDMEMASVGAHPADRGFRIVDVRRPAVLRVEPVVARDRHKAAFGEGDGMFAHAATFAHAPTATVKQEGSRCVVGVRWRVDVTAKVDFATAAEYDTFLDRHIHAGSFLFVMGAPPRRAALLDGE